MGLRLTGYGVTVIESWRQSSITQYMRCPRLYRLQHVDRVQRDHSMSGYAGPLGTACHAVIESVLTSRVPLSRQEVVSGLQRALQRAVESAQSKGDHTDPDGIERAFGKAEGAKADLIMRLQEDPRIRSIDWQHTEHRFTVPTSSGRTFTGTVDAIGTVRDPIPVFGSDGREAVGLFPGDRLLADWKTGEAGPPGYVERALNVQLAVYSWALRQSEPTSSRVHACIGRLADLEKYKRPRGEDGAPIKAKLRRISEEWLEATGLSEAMASVTQRRPRREDGTAIRKWVEEPNPAFEAARDKPRGPLFHVCRLDEQAAWDTIRAVIHGAELGLFPASGSLTGQCMLCPYRGSCISHTRRTTNDDRQATGRNPGGQGVEGRPRGHGS